MSDVAKLLPLSALVALVLVGAAPGGARVQPRTITVMTRNLYLGANLDPILQAKSFPDALGAVATRWQLVQANDFRVRAGAIAHEIQTVRPDVVGFQELVLYRTQTPSDFLQSSARSVVLDYKAELQHALRARKLGYHFVGVDTNTDAELPSGSPATMDIRLTVRNGLLVKNGVRIRNVRIGNFRASDPVIPGLVTATRGWVSADATVGGRTFRVIVTHLESFKPAAVAEAQSLELIDGPARTRLPVVLLGDLNSRPDGSTTKSYANFIGAGFTDAWAQAYPGRPGLTCCHGEDLRIVGGPFTERIDYVLTRGRVRALRGGITGEAPSSRLGGLWPSDHGGLWMTLRLPG
ncbi:MAG: endonuclease [Actinobacteria bacterium]|nr:MAG: endonuclease [Actinomycetota bacterium]